MLLNSHSSCFGNEMGAYSTKLRSVSEAPNLDDRESDGETEMEAGAVHDIRKDKEKQLFLFAYFRTSSETLHFALSLDGLQFRPLNLNMPLLQATRALHLTGTVRDPFILRLENGGGFVLVHSDGWQSRSFIMRRSLDLVHWSPDLHVPVMEGRPDIGCVWAPKAFYDRESKDYVVIFASALVTSMDNKAIYGCRTKDWKTFSHPFTLFDPGVLTVLSSCS